MKLGVNIDHIATLRQARQATEPDPVRAALMAQEVGVDQITAHIRMDRRHIQDNDLFGLKAALKIPLNVEMSTADDMLELALKIQPSKITLVPERREEITTEGGLNAIKFSDEIIKFQQAIAGQKCQLSLFVDPDPEQVQAAALLKIPEIEINTAKYSEANDQEELEKETKRVQIAADFGRNLGLKVAAGHGLTSKNLPPIVKIKTIEELNIGHHIVAEAIFMGWRAKLEEILNLLQQQ